LRTSTAAFGECVRHFGGVDIDENHPAVVREERVQPLRIDLQDEVALGGVLIRRVPDNVGGDFHDCRFKHHPVQFGYIG
jgi:hypothetical protein